MKIQYLSDVHLEFRFNLPKIKKLADILVLAGDIGYPKSKIYLWFIKEMSKKFEKVFIICGNHEYYENSIVDIDSFIEKNIIQMFHNVTFLNNSFEDYKGIRYIGTTLWTDKENTNCSDFLCIDELKKQQQYKTTLYNNSKTFIEKIVSTSHDKKNVLITHHQPPEDFLNNNIVAWIYGHTHTPCSKSLNGILYVCNPIGYPEEYHINHRYNKIFEI